MSQVRPTIRKEDEPLILEAHKVILEKLGLQDGEVSKSILWRRMLNYVINSHNLLPDDQVKKFYN